MQRGINPGKQHIWMPEQQQIELIQNFYQDFRKIKTIVYLNRYRDLGFGRCNVCLKDFKQQERVKRFPRECDHIFHIKCLEVWMKIEASCPTCCRDYLGFEYRNINFKPNKKDTDSDYYSNVNALSPHLPESLSIFNQWKKEEQAFDP